MTNSIKERDLLKVAGICSLIGLIIVFFISGEIEGASKEVFEENSPPEFYFCPEDDCINVIANLMRNASSVVCAFYDLKSEEVINELKTKDDLKLVIDSNNAKGLTLKYVTNYGKQLMHNKFCIFDNKTVLTGSFNPTHKAKDNDNNMIVLHSKYFAENYQAEFDELFNRRFGSGEKIRYPIIYLNGVKFENYFCPEDSCKHHVLESLERARNSVTFMTFSFTDDDIGNLLIKKYNQGVEVRGVFEKFQNNAWNEYERLKQNGLDVRWDENKNNMHHKVFIIDENIVITGSYNPTKSANTINDENIVIIHDKNIAKRFSTEFERVWPKSS